MIRASIAWFEAMRSGYNPHMRVIGMAGWSGAGKTTLLARMIPCLVARGVLQLIACLHLVRARFGVFHQGRRDPHIFQ